MLIKTQSDIKNIIKGGEILGKILDKLIEESKAGVSTLFIDQLAEKMIVEAGGKPAFKNYQNCPSDTPFPCTICASLNHELVHGIARPNVILKDGDIFSIDIGMEYPIENKKPGFFTDTAVTLIVGNVKPEIKKLLEVTRESLKAGIKAVRPGNSIGDIGKAIEKYVSAQGNYGIVRDLVGHGVGHAVHEEPRIPNYYDKKMDHFKIKPGMVLALEPMISLGSYKVRSADDGWTIETADRSLCAHFEHTVVVTDSGCVIATKRPSEK